MVEDGYEFFADRQLVTMFTAPNYCGEFDNAGAMMTVDENLMCSFQILKPAERKLMGGFGRDDGVAAEHAAAEQSRREVIDANKNVESESASKARLAASGAVRGWTARRCAHR